MSTDLSTSRVAVLGAGKMGGILLQAFLKQQILTPDRLFATVAHADRAERALAQWGIEVCTGCRHRSESRRRFSIGGETVSGSRAASKRSARPLC